MNLAKYLDGPKKKGYIFLFKGQESKKLAWASERNRFARLKSMNPRSC
jgi:hypothetical protein